MSSEIDILVEMGFPRNRAEKALSLTGNKGVESAMEWLFEHSEDPDIDEPYKPLVGHVLGETAVDDSATQAAEDGSEKVPVENSELPSNAAAGGIEQPQQALSLVCDDCGKRLRSENDVQLHAARSGHSNFSESSEEIKPLTEEEKKQQAEKLQQRLKERREQRLEQEKKEALEKEKSRRITGKELTSVKQKREMQEAKQIADERRREKMEEKLARQRVKDQIARDKAERAEKFGKGGEVSTNTQPSVAAAAVPAQPAVEKKQHTTCKLQFRLTNGTAITGTFQATDTLETVRAYVHENRTDGSAPFNLMTTFPRKTYTDRDLGTSLQDAGLVPSAVLILTKI